jgi:hypothetical protein
LRRPPALSGDDGLGKASIMETLIMDKPTTRTDPRKAAEDFIEKVIVPRRQARRKDPETARARAELAREEAELAKREMAAAGFDLDRLQKLAAESSEKRKKLAEDSRRRAVDASAEVSRHLADIAPVILPIEPLDTVIDQVTFIRSFLGQGTVLESNIAPSDNWARYRLDSSVDDGSLPGRLSFFTIWQNKRNSPTLVMARPNLVINAHLGCDAGGSGLFGGTPELAEATVRVRTTVWGMDSSVSSIVYDREVGYARAYSNWIFGDYDSDSIEFNELLLAAGVAIPAQAYSLVEVELLTEWKGIGSVVLDAEGGSHRVDVPQIVLTELQTPEPPPPPPPISLTAGVDYDTSPATVTLIFTGATGALVDIFQDGVRLGDTTNDGTWTRQLPPGTYQFRVCERLSSVCSTDVTVTVTQ